MLSRGGSTGFDACRSDALAPWAASDQVLRSQRFCLTSCRAAVHGWLSDLSLDSIASKIVNRRGEG